MSTEVPIQFIFSSKRVNQLQLAQTLASVSEFGEETRYSTKRSFSREAVHGQVEVFHPDTVNDYLSGVSDLLSPDIVVWRIGRFDPFQPRSLVPTNNYRVTLNSKVALDHEELARQAKKVISTSFRDRVTALIDNICTPYKDMNPETAAKIHIGNPRQWFPPC